MDGNYYIAVSLLWINFLVWREGHCLELSQLVSCPSECDISKCPVVQYCTGQVVKDACGCCPKCSSDMWIHPKYPVVRKGGSCEQVKCPKFKVCMENMQGLPLCTCPNILICKRRRRSSKEVCGNDGNTYQSRCHMRVTGCTIKTRLKVRHKGPCSSNSYMVATQQYGGTVKYPDSEYDLRRRRKKNRRKDKRKQKHKKLRRRKRRQRKRKYDYQRHRRQKTRFFNNKKQKVTKSPAERRRS
ncbi:follistatin-related protein 3-like [Mizuhopecten yessoensis]|uniref:Follistatin-related protein 3 n=1 Tax=Mizuhopecten yessoensis TaxID=6573 RepID=A0A210QNU6_MIZYE|nr:follistatin-related protein 3-like [Mizuhopecten yessoensis]OWF50420.1 Follistatin-related protein 3 [Mizuhopecten yessoensis]